MRDQSTAIRRNRFCVSTWIPYITPFNDHIRRDDMNEIIIDSTFKTNQEKFELFTVIINCGGYGVPLAYLYVDTFTAPDDRLQDEQKFLKNSFSH